jgi:GNAT superfamily N-acetyltransferase
MKLEIHASCSDFKSYRAARVKSLFNAESGCNFDLVAELPDATEDWRLGVIVGPSGSGKTSLGRKIFGDAAVWEPTWPAKEPIIDAIAPDGDFNAVTAALAAVGLGTVPAWLRPYPVLSNGEKFRASLARLVCEAPAQVVVDEFSSVVDRQIAKFGALAFGKAWKRTGGKAVLLTCHFDVIPWLEPDWCFDTSAGGRLARGGLQRPRFDVELWETDWRYWPAFETHHYLKVPKMIAATNYVGTVEGELVAHVAVSTRPGMREARACRLVIMPEWQGAGIGLRFLNEVCERWRRGENRHSKPMPTLFHTSHPGLCAALRRDRRWRQVSAVLHGGNKIKSGRSIARSAALRGRKTAASGYGGHMRAVQGFRYYGDAGLA